MKTRVLIATATSIFLITFAFAVRDRPLDTAGAVGEFAVAIDCDVASVTIENFCATPPETGVLEIDVYFKNDSAAAVTLGAFNFDVVTPNQEALNPPTVVGGSLDVNPNFTADTTDLGDWLCFPPSPNPDQDPSVTIARSFISCYNNAGTGPVVAPGATVALARVSYDIVDGYATASFSLDKAQVFDDDIDELMSCNPTVSLPGDCTGATVGTEAGLWIDANPTNGTRPCAPIDVVRSVSEGVPHSVAICLFQNQAGAPESIALAIDYDSVLSSGVVDAGTAPDHLDASPDLNDGPGPNGVGTGWDCSIGGINPPSAADPTLLACTGSGEQATDPGLLATLEFTHTGIGVEPLSFVPDDTSIDGIECNAGLSCHGATLKKLGAPPATCPLTLEGSSGQSGSTYWANVNSPLKATGRIPAGKSGLTLRVRRPDTSLVISQAYTGAPGDVVKVGFLAKPPGPLTVECVVDAVVESSATINLILIDPSGRVFDQASGATLVGAVVELQVDSDNGAGESWVPMDVVTHDGFFEPEINQETTGLDGRYAWDVAPYYPVGTPDPTNNYRVVVTAADCAGATSAVVTVPPPALDLDVGLTCTDSDGDGLRNLVETGATGTNPAVADTDLNGTPDGDEDADGDGLTNAAEVNTYGTDPLAVDSDGDGLGDGAEPGLGTSPLVADTDADGFKDVPASAHLLANANVAVDNCPTVDNATQANNDANFIDTSPPYVVAIDDKTWPMSDALGDVCDLDDDNDGISDTDEASGAACGGIITNPLLFDTDGDQARDGAECSIGTNPTNAGSEPALTACGAAGDADSDKISNRTEFCYYGTNTTLIDSDGDAVGGLDADGGRDGCEIASINGDQIVSSGDQGKLASGISGATPYHAGVDINKDGLLNSGDQGLMASFISPPGQCPG